MAAERVRTRSQCPYMYVMNVEDAGDIAHGIDNRLQVEPSGQSFQQNIERFANNIDRAPDDEAANQDRQHRIDGEPSRVADENGADDDGDGSQRVPQHMN